MPAAPLPLRILVIDDDPDTAEGLSDLLELFGHTPARATDGRDGVALAREFAPDVVLCDLTLPGLDGFGVARELRADPQLAHTRLVAVSGHAHDDIRNALDAAGFDEHLPKPVNIDALQAALLGAGSHPPRHARAG